MKRIFNLLNAKIDVTYRKKPIIARSGRGNGDGVAGMKNFNVSYFFIGNKRIINRILRYILK